MTNLDRVTREPLRALVVMNLFPPHSFGGYEDLCSGAVDAWRGAGHDVRVLTSRFRRPDVDDVDEPHVQRVLPLSWSDHRMLTPSLRTQRRDQIDARDAVNDHVSDFRPHVVSVWNPGALPLAGLFTAIEATTLPVVLVVGDRWLVWGPETDPWSRRFHRPRWRAARGAIAGFAGVAATTERIGAPTLAAFASEYLRQDALARAAWPFDDHALVPHGPDLGRYPLLDPSADAGAWRGRLLYVGRLAADKGVETAVRVLARAATARLDVHGTGDEAFVRSLRDVAEHEGVSDRVEFHGDSAPDRLRRAYDGADALVFPSVWPEPFGIVPLEAMARGLPVVATGTGGSGEFLIEGTTALRFPPGDVTGLSDRLDELAADPRLRQRLRRNGLEVARWLSRDRAHDDLLAWHLHAAGRIARPAERGVLPPSLAESGERS
ncbi:MAG: glycosyltransferase family 4 protein [Actinobacteria bacterium]|nr:glycosyltransferase family 4 protein [Actinomycetota bacterium]